MVVKEGGVRMAGSLFIKRLGLLIVAECAFVVPLGEKKRPKVIERAGCSDFFSIFAGYF